jgi:GTPase SAR1 family protein
LIDKNKKILREYLSLDEPFGPIDACDIAHNPQAFEMLFERHNKIYETLHKRSSIIIGRRGSGKTSYLQSVCFDESYKHVIKLRTSDVLSSAIESISKIQSEAIFTDSIRDIWEEIIYIGLFSQIWRDLPKNSKARGLINDYLPKIGITENGTIDDVVWKIADVISKRAKDKTHGVISGILTALDTVTFNLVLKELEAELEKNNLRAVVLMDSLDDFKLNTNIVGEAIKGLLKFIGEANHPSTRIDIRFCLPAELINTFMALSSNPNKDFKRKLLLRWTAPELISLAAHRLILFSHAYDNHPLSISKHQLLVLNEFNSNRFANALKEILPEKITCRLGISEDPIAYIIRHTQLLPRHLLMILNEICLKSRKYPSSVPRKISEEAIKEGISSVEETLTQEIFTAYKTVYPQAENVCRACIPEMQHRFSIGDLQRVFRSHGKKAMENNDFDDFKRMLIEMGIVGCVIDDKDRYIQAKFEYTAQHQLVSSTSDTLCFHPLFTEIFSAKTDEKKPVYPYGTQLDDMDYRNDH